MFLGKFAGLQAAGKQFLQKLLDKRYIKLYNTHVTKVTPCGPLAQLAESRMDHHFFAHFLESNKHRCDAGLRHSEVVPDGDFYFK